MSEYYIVRHTQPNVAQGVCYGITDLSLADSFEQEFLQILAMLPQDFFFFFTPIYSSPLQRCYVLAQKIHDKMYKIAENPPQNIENIPPVITDKRLQEMDFGDWEMKKWDGIPEESWKIWKNDWVNNPAPNGESQLVVYKRVVECVNEIIAQSPNGAIIVCHYGVLVNILAHFFEIPLKNAFRHEFTFGAVLRITKKGEDYIKIKVLKS